MKPQDFVLYAVGCAVFFASFGFLIVSVSMVLDTVLEWKRKK